MNTHLIMKKILLATIALLACFVGSAMAQPEALFSNPKLSAILSSYRTFDYQTMYLDNPYHRFTFILPVDEGFTFVDPVSMATETPQVWQLKYDDSSRQTYAEVYNAELAAGKWTATGEYVTRVGFRSNRAIGPYQGLNNSQGDKLLANRLEDLIKSSIIIGDVTAEKEYYKTLANTFVRIKGGKIYGSDGSALNIQETVQLNNGTAYIVDSPLQPQLNSVASTLSQHPEFSEFLKVLNFAGAVSKTDSWNGQTAAVSGDGDGNLYNLKEWGDVGAEIKPVNSGRYKPTYLLNGYHYTIYAPTNEAMQKAYAMGLPTPEDIEKYESDEYWSREEEMGLPHHKVDSLREVLLNFVKYHIQDNAIFTGMSECNGKYPTAKYEFIPATYYDEEKGSVATTGKYQVGRPYGVSVTSSGTNLSVWDFSGNTANTLPALSNIMAREYWVSGSRITKAYQSVTSQASFAVIHGIDNPLIYDSSNQFQYRFLEIENN